MAFPIKKTRICGMTLVEMLIAVAVGSLAFAAIGKLTLFTARSFVALGNYNDLDNASRNALDIMSREIRQTKGLVQYNTNKLVFTDYDDLALTYEWNPTARTLTRFKTNQVQVVLLRQCDSLLFGKSQRNPSNNFGFYTSADAKTTKLIDVSWRCSRQIFQKKVNTESVQTAKIVIRN